MAQLPPKIPNLAPNWNNVVFDHHKKTPSLPTDTFLPSFSPMTNVALRSGNVVDQQSWVDDFLDFSSGKRGMSNPSNHDFYDHVPMSEFQRMEDNQIMSMFVDDVPPPVDSPSFSDRQNAASTPSDHNRTSDGDDDEEEEEEEEQTQSRCILEISATTVKPAENTIADLKRVKRILANRQSAQRSRVRKLQYISELERSVTYLQTEVSALSPRVAFLDHQRSALNVGNNALQQRIAVLAQDKLFKDAHHEALKKEIERLSEVYQQQNRRSSTRSDANPTPEPTFFTANQLVGS